jgi:S-phase kinase-associated protein 1
VTFYYRVGLWVGCNGGALFCSVLFCSVWCREDALRQVCLFVFPHGRNGGSIRTTTTNVTCVCCALCVCVCFVGFLFHCPVPLTLSYSMCMYMYLYGMNGTLQLSKEDVEFIVPLEVAKMSELVSSMLDEASDDDDDNDNDNDQNVNDGDNDNTTNIIKVPLLNVSTRVLQQVLEFCIHYHTIEPMPWIEKGPLRSTNLADLIPPWYATFVNDMDKEELFQLLLAANYMNIEALLNLTGPAIASRIMGKSVGTNVCCCCREYCRLLFSNGPNEEEKEEEDSLWINKNKKTHPLRNLPAAICLIFSLSSTWDPFSYLVEWSCVLCFWRTCPKKNKNQWRGTPLNQQSPSPSLPQYTLD